MNPLSIIILVFLSAFVIFVIIYLIKHKGENCSMCSGNCEHCKKKYQKILERDNKQKEKE